MIRFSKVSLGLLLAVSLLLVGCNGSAPTDVADTPPTSVEESTTDEDTLTEDPDETGSVEDDPPVEIQVDGPSVIDDETEMVAVSIYVMDDSCNDFQSESVEVPADEAMTEAVGEVLERHRFEAFKVSGYRVNVEDSTAVVDLRLAEDSERQFLSLSSCEQQGLFGGLEETLIQNPTWQVQQVEFTNRGEEIVL
ncbi:MAG: sporulation/spore germination protein [Cyanobacteria bacterium P01_C01_bin.118]